MIKKYIVDIPSSDLNESDWIAIKYFDSHKEAIEFARKYFGADEEGRVCLISEIEEQEEEIKGET